MLRALRTLPQPRQHFQAAIAIGRCDPRLDLKVPDRLHGVVAGAAVGAAGIEAGPGEARLHLLDFGKRQRALRAREWLEERRSTQDAVAEMDDGERIIHRWIIAPHRIEVWSQQERRPAWHRRPEPRARVRLRKRPAVGARDAGALPGRIGAACSVAPAACAHLIAPMLAAMISAAVHEKFCG